MRLTATLFACVAAIAGCNADPQVDARNASAEDVAKKVAAAGGSDMFVRPGKWQSTVQIEQFELPGAPPEAASAMRSIQQRS